LEGQSFRIWQPGINDHDPMVLSIPLLGPHQVTNAVVAYAALTIFDQKRYKVSLDAITNGFANAFWPGRFEVIQRRPAVILDCAHNRDSAQKLRITLEEYFPGKHIVMIFGASEDKDIQGMFLELMPVLSELIVVKSFHPRAIEPAKLVELAKPFNRPVHIVDHIPEALEKGLQLVGDNEVVLVTGSIFVVAEARKYLEKKVNIRRY
jgi:dihydrofolate synthase/folylpolyglutamate synthase